MVSTRVLAVETDGADSLDRSRVLGKHVALDRVTSRAKSLGAVKVCERAYSYLANPNLFNCVVSDDEAQVACESFLEDHRVKVELACGAALSPVYEPRHDPVKEARSILVVVCGGVSD